MPLVEPWLRCLAANTILNNILDDAYGVICELEQKLMPVVGLVERVIYAVVARSNWETRDELL